MEQTPKTVLSNHEIETTGKSKLDEAGINELIGQKCHKTIYE